MTNHSQTIVLLTVFVPILGSLTIPLAGLISRRARSVWAVTIGLATAGLSLLLIPFALSGGELVWRLPMALGLDFVLLADGLAVFMAAVSSFVGALIVIYSLGYIGHEENQNEYYLMVLLFIGAMMGLVFSANLIFLYLFWEIAAIACWRLIGFYRKPEHVIKADKAFLVTFFGAVVMLLGFIQIYGQTNTFDITAMRGVVVPGTAVLLILVGMFSKSATAPLHTWLPDAGVAPTTVTALLHAAVLVKIGVYAYARLFCYTFKLPAGWTSAIPILAVLSSLIAAGAATVETDFKRILAYSTVSQIGYIFLGFAALNPIGIAGSALFILMHGLAKAGLFLCAGIVIHATHQRDIRQTGRVAEEHAADRPGISFLRLFGHRHPAVWWFFLQADGHRRRGQGRPDRGGGPGPVCRRADHVLHVPHVQRCVSGRGQDPGPRRNRWHGGRGGHFGDALPAGRPVGPLPVKIGGCGHC